jgi:predicted nucleic acid-binding protein
MTSSGAEPIARLVLDTSTYSHFRKGDERVIDLMTSADIIVMPTVVLGELYGAFEAGTRVKENERVLFDFLAEPFLRVIPTTASVARQYGRIYGVLRRAGLPIPTNDMWIAAATVDCGGRLLTFDTHFKQIPDFDCIVLSPEP